MDDRPSTSSAPQILPLKLRASDDTILEADEDVASKSSYIKKKIDRLKQVDPTYSWLDRPIPVRKVDGATLAKLLEWCVEHRHEIYRPKLPHEDPRIKLTESDKRYMDVSSDMLLAMCIGAHDLGIPGIVDIVTQKIANMADGKTTEEIRQIYMLPDDSEQPEPQPSKKAKRRERRKQLQNKN